MDRSGPKTKEDCKDSLVFQRDLAEMLGQEVKALHARVKELEQQLSVAFKAEDAKADYAKELQKENARLQKLVDMNQRLVDAAREAMKYTDHTFAPNFPDPIAKLKNAIRELDTSTCVAPAGTGDKGEQMRINYLGQVPRIKCGRCNLPMLGVGEQDPSVGFFTAGTGLQFCCCPNTSTERATESKEQYP